MTRSEKQSTDCKNERLREIIASYGRLAVAFSSGVDSAFLLKTAHDVLGEKVLAVTAEAPVFPKRERDGSLKFCEAYGIRRIAVQPELLSSEAFRINPPDRCYHCKRLMMGAITDAARENGFFTLAEGSNADDVGDYRPGLRAVRELNIVSPLMEAGLTKAEIRELSRDMGLSTWDKPSFACLASRFEYGNSITVDKLSAVEGAEEMLFRAGYKQFRVRVHNKIARIELYKEDIPEFISSKVRDEVSSSLRSSGFDYVTVDLEGFRSGSMNKGIVNET